MPQVIVNPEEVRRFAGDLRQFNRGVNESASRLHGQFRRLGETWRDQEHARFAAEFEQTLVAIRRFMEASEQYVPFLIRKAEAAEAYLASR